jgi:hypothetical protein
MPEADIEALRRISGTAGRFLLDREGKLILRDQSLDVVFRVIFPAAYMYLIATLYGAMGGKA